MPPPNMAAKRLALLLVDQAPQRQGIGLLADMPVGRPGELAEAGDAAGLGHARQTEIEPVGQQPRHQDAAVGGDLAGAQMGEAVGEQRPSRHLGQQIGDADARQHGVETRGQCLGLRRRRFLDRARSSARLCDRHVRAADRPWRGYRPPPAAHPAGCGGSSMNCSKSGSTATGNVPVCRSSCRVALGDQTFLEGAVSPAAGDPDLAGAQPVAQLRQHAKFIVTAVNLTAGQHVRRPALADEAGWRGFRQDGRARAVHLAQHLDRAHERGGMPARSRIRTPRGRPATSAGCRHSARPASGKHRTSSGRASASASATRRAEPLP